MVKQVGLLPAGCQPWNTDVVATSGNRFLYSATLAIYVYELDKKYNEFKLASIMSEHKKTITGVAFSPKNSDIFASSSADKIIIVWNCAEEKVIARLNGTKDMPIGVGWCFHKVEAVTFTSKRGPMCLWKYQDVASVTHMKEAASFAHDVCHFRWHPKNTAKVVLGHQNGTISVCIIGGKSNRHMCPPDDDDDVEDEDPVTAMEWDPLSQDYLLVANTFSRIRMIDSNTFCVIMNFQLPSVASQVSSLSWVDNAPGIFVTGDAKSGILRIWNVSRSTPIESIRFQKTGIHALQTICSSSLIHSNSHSMDHRSRISTSMVHAPTTNHSNFVLPPAQIVCTFSDGGVGLYDLGKRKWIFFRDQGHIETIFDCKFHPENPDLLATASFDGTIKVWDINSLTAVSTSPGNEGVVYCLSWAPGDLNCIVGSTSKNGIFIWNVSQNKITHRFQEHGKAAVYSVAWGQKDSKRIMSVGSDGYCVVRLVNGEIVQRYRHPAPVYGCDWSPTNKDMLATGCEDMCVRVYYIITSSDQPLRIFQGHTAKVFHVKWSPLREGILCSGSDDKTIRVWDYTQETCTCVLKGHEAPVRGLLWNTEIPYLLISGSWDCKIRIWDTRDGACLETILDHGADVYGLTCHPQRPFLLASSSRDSTLRLWSLNSLVQPIEMNIIAGKPWSDIMGTTEAAMAIGNPPLLAGRASKDIRQSIEHSHSGDARAKKLQSFSKFFCQPRGTSNLWELVSVVKGIDDTLLSQNYHKGVMHVKHLIKFKSSEAQTLEMYKMTLHSSSTASASKLDKIREAAQIHISVGNIQRYCELMVELGEWEKALSVAPGVSMKYWHALSKRYTDFLLKQDSEKVVPIAMAAGEMEKLIGYFTFHGQASDVMLSAQVACEGLHHYMDNVGTSNHVNHNTCNGGNPSQEKYTTLLHQSVKQLAEWYYNNGSPELAACCHLAVDDCQSAVWKLVQGHELELAVAVGTVLGNTPKQTNLAIEYLSRRCEHLCKWDLAVDLLNLLPNPELLLSKCCSRCSASMDEINILHKRAGLPSLDECLHKAETLKMKLDLFECVKYYLLSSSPETALEIGLNDVKGAMSTASWTVENVFPMLQLLGCIRADKIQQHKCDRLRSELLCLSAYVGALMAIRKGFDSIVNFQLHHARAIMTRDSLVLPVSITTIDQQIAAWMAFQKKQNSGTVDASTATSDLGTAYQTLLDKAGVDKEAQTLGPDVVGHSNLPSHSDVHVSCITGQRAQGLAYFLEDGRSAISPSEALMWAKVNPFSPLGSGLRIIPF